MRRLPALVLVFALALAAGCGGGDGEAKDEFVKQANRNCEERQLAEKELAERDEEEFAEDPDAVWRFYERELAAQRKLDPPEELADDWKRYLELFQKGGDLFRRLSEADEGVDYNERSVMERDARRASVQARQIAKRIGLDVCGNAFY